MRVNNESIINACSASISPAILLAVLAKSNLHWEMHQAQVYALESLSFSGPVEVVESEETKEIFLHQTNITLLGIPVKVDNENYPKGLIRLMSGDKEIARVEMLGVPGVFFSEDDFTEEGMKREREKFAKLTY